MHIGIQLIAPEGFRELEKNVTYYFLKSESLRDYTLLLKFEFKVASTKSPKAILLMMNRAHFENGLVQKFIIPAEHQSKIPPWLAEWEELDFSLLDLSRPAAKKLHSERVDERLAIIQPVLDRQNAILSSENPDLELNKYARECVPRQNETRLRLWFYAYLCFGRNVWSLIPSYCRIGIWSRHKNFPTKKFGRKSIARGAHHGYPVDHEMAKKICESFVIHRGLGQRMTKIYSKAMSNNFGCNVHTNHEKKKSYVHPQGKPFPSFHQFKYWVNKTFGTEEVRRTLYGDTRYRTRMAASKGKFSEMLSNLLERIELDAYYTKDYPSSIVEGKILPPLCVVRGVCCTSGAVVGIGFAFGKEHSSAYRMMLFSMTMPKADFCKLFGLDILAEDWPCQGMSPWLSIDRGPGSKADLIKNLEDKFPIRELAPSWAGQSKAAVESSHPRNVNLEGQPTHVQSALNPVEMARREILQLIKDNHASDASARLTPAMIAANINPSPIGIWNYLDDRARTDAYSMDFDHAIKTFLTPTELTAQEDGIYWSGIRYDSAVLRATSLLDQVATGQRTKVKGYILDMAVRHVWVEVQGKIIQIDAHAPISVHDRELYLSLPELQQLSENKRATDAEFRTHQLATNTEIFDKFEDATGKGWDDGKRKSGPPKSRARSSQMERDDIKKYTSANKAK